MTFLARFLLVHSNIKCGNMNHIAVTNCICCLKEGWKMLRLINTALVANRKGFTLLELMSVLVIMGVMLSVAIRKFDMVSDTGSITALRAGVRELNTQETLVWIDMKLSDTGWTKDVDVYNAVGKNLGQGYRWSPGPAITGGTLHHEGQSVALVRTPSTRDSAGSWI
jgi:prepilin-type N-terminal cleavage/methylation domain-containing protein